MKEMKCDLCHGEDQNFERDDASLYNLSYRRKSLPTTTIRLAGSCGILLAQSDLEFKRPLLSHSLDSSEWESDVSMEVAFKKLFVNMASTSQVEPEEDIEPFNADPWAQ